MPYKDLYNLDWSTFQSHLLYTSKELYKDKLFADVTLLSDDLIQIKAHKTVLSSASEFFKQLFTENESKSCFLILLGVKSKDLQAVMEFIYLGGAKLEEDYVGTFLETARHLGIKQLNIKQEESLDKKEVMGDALEDSHEGSQNSPMQKGIKAEQGASQTVFHNQENKSTKDCEQCSAKFVNNWSLRRHISSIHNKLTFECEKCSKKVSTIDSLKRHKKLLHGGTVLNCSLCNYSTVWPFHLKEHNTRKHPSEADVKPDIDKL